MPPAASATRLRFSRHHASFQCDIGGLDGNSAASLSLA
jgi:hypothetical protein